MAPSRGELPRDYRSTLANIKQRIQEERIRVVAAANSAMVGLYWDIGRLILDRQRNAGWGAKVIDCPPIFGMPIPTYEVSHPEI